MKLDIIYVMVAGIAYASVTIMVILRLWKRRSWWRKVAIGLAWPIVGLLVWWFDD